MGMRSTIGHVYDPFDRKRVYEIVLREAVGVDELTTWLDAATLRRLWPELYLPRGVRRAWELRFPDLAGRQAAASVTSPRRCGGCAGTAGSRPCARPRR